MKSFAPLIILLFINSVAAVGQQTDSSATAVLNNSALFFDASSDSHPRQVSLGLPTNSSSAVQIFEDGLPVSYYIYHLMPYKSWHGGAGASSNGKYGPQEVAMHYGEINNCVSSVNVFGSEEFKGTFSYTFGMYGQHKIDAGVSGPLGGGWQYALSTYLNFDPGSNHLQYPKLPNSHQYYKGVLTKRFDAGRLSLVLQHVDYRSLQDNFGPFIFVGDGSVRPYEGFDLGHDSYRPAEESFVYMDFLTGEIKTLNFMDGTTDHTNHATLEYEYKLGSGVHLDLRSRFKDGISRRGSGSLSGIDNVSTDAGYTYVDGTPFSGPLQKRQVLSFDTFERSLINNAELTGRTGRHSWVAGVDVWLNHAGTVTSSSLFSHEVKADPEILLYNGEKYYYFNTSGEYYDGRERKYALYASDRWLAGKRLEISAFVRAEGQTVKGDAANNIGGDTSNSRTAGFNMTKGHKTSFDETFLNGAFGAEVIYKLAPGLSFQGDYTFTRIHTVLMNYAGYAYPTNDPTDTYLARAGFSYVNSWINVLSQVNYIEQKNYKFRAVFQHVLQHDCGGLPAGHTESLAIPLNYGVASLGWVTDAILTPFEGFSLHLEITLRNPQYKDFVFDPTFSDGVTEHYDFSGRNVTNLHKFELSADPSYSVDAWRFWLTARYISRQYINKTNSMYFKGRVETFGGIDYKMQKGVTLNLNIVNLFNQKGASGTISSADLVEDASAYHDYLMAGTFIRPFTIELGATVKF